MTNTLEKQDIKAEMDILNFFRTWFQPRSTDRDRAFRERIIRIALAVLLIGTVLYLANGVFIYHDPWGLISFPSISLYGIVLYAGAAYAITVQRFVLAGLLLTLGVFVLIMMLSVIALQQNQELGLLTVAAFMLIPLIATLVLPRRYTLFFALVSALAYGGLVIFSATNTDASPTSEFITAVLVIGLEAAMLYQFRSEFDARLDAVSQSLDQERLAKEQAEVARQRAESADKAKSQFLANMSHELRTPLNAIIGYDEAMLGGMVGEFTPKQHQLLGHIQYNSRRLLGLINDVLDLSKIESGSLRVFAAPMSPQEVITRTVESVRNLAQEKGLAVEVAVAENVPELVMGDEKKVEQVVVNLVGNAIKFTNTGGVYVDVTAPDVKNWQFKVRDTGIGIAPDKIGDIFEPFQQVDNSSTRKFKGTGLGLSISKRLVEILNGTVEVTSELDKGTTFTITLPRSVVEALSLEDQMKQAKSKAEHPLV